MQSYVDHADRNQCTTHKGWEDLKKQFPHFDPRFDLSFARTWRADAATQWPSDMLHKDYQFPGEKWRENNKQAAKALGDILAMGGCI